MHEISNMSAISLMFCGNAAADVMLAYVEFISDKLLSMWVENGPSVIVILDQRVDVLTHFVLRTEDLSSMVLPILQIIPLKKVLIGDYLRFIIRLK